MKLKLKNYFFIVLAILIALVFGLPSVYMTKNAKAQETGDIYEIADNELNNTVLHPFYDLSGNDNVSLLSLDNNDSCSQYCAKHGNGRKNGGVDLLNNGCRGYKLNGFNYGSNLIPYWINMAEVNKLANETQKTSFFRTFVRK